MPKEHPHRIDALAHREKKLHDFERETLIEYYDLAMKFAPRIMANDLVITTWLLTVVKIGQVSIGEIRQLCMAERIHRELSA